MGGLGAVQGTSSGGGLMSQKAKANSDIAHDDFQDGGGAMSGSKRTDSEDDISGGAGSQGADAGRGGTGVTSGSGHGRKRFQGSVDGPASSLSLSKQEKRRRARNQNNSE